MNKKLLAVAVVGALASPLAFAQNVTLYGGIDVGLQHADSNQAGAQNFVNSGSWYTSRIGIKGSDDLGGGLSAIIVAEHGLFADTGLGDDESTSATSHGFWQRQVYGGLDSKQWGALTIGRQYTHMHNQSAGTGSLLATTLAGTLGWSGHQVRASNAIKFSSANYGGFNFGALYSFGANATESTTFTDNGKYWEAHAGFAKAPFAIDFAHSVLKAGDIVSTAELKRNQLVGKWDAGAFALAAGWVTDKAEDTAAGTVGDFRTIWVQPGFRFGGNNEVYASYAKRKDKSDGEATTTWYGVAYRHLFTKRTYAYANWGQTKNDDGANLRPYSYAGPAPAAGEKAKGFGVGLAQEF
jgi:general bacterial porin, GBP family